MPARSSTGNHDTPVPGRSAHTGEVTSSDWSVVDVAPDPRRRLVTGLDTLRAEPFFAQSKARMAALLEPWRPTRNLDVGCGTGDDAIVLLLCSAVGVERSTVMCAEARARYPTLALIAADAARAADSREARSTWCGPSCSSTCPTPGPCCTNGGASSNRAAIWCASSPDLTTATVDGVDAGLAAVILDWRRGTRPGAATVHELPGSLRAAGFSDVHVDAVTLDLGDLDRADGIMGLAGWGRAAADAGLLSRDDVQQWTDDVHAAAVPASSATGAPTSSAPPRTARNSEPRESDQPTGSFESIVDTGPHLRELLRSSSHRRATVDTETDVRILRRAREEVHVKRAGWCCRGSRNSSSTGGARPASSVRELTVTRRPRTTNASSPWIQLVGLYWCALWC